MDRSATHLGYRLSVGLFLLAMLGISGCKMVPGIAYLIMGNDIEAEYEELQGKRVMVVCRPPSTLDFRFGGVDRKISKRVGALLSQNVKEIDVVKHSDVEEWTDERGWADLEELATEVKADLIVRIDLEDFDLLKGPTLYQGRAETLITVIDMNDGGREVWTKPMGEVLFPENSAVPAQEKALGHFQRQYLELLSQRIARHFYKHDAYVNFATDSVAHQ
jgi:hypothetical protein